MFTLRFYAEIDDMKRNNAIQCLIDNGIDAAEAETVLQVLGYNLLDQELFPEEMACKGVCDICGKEADVIQQPSSMCPRTFSYCEDCMKAKAEPYEVMVSYIGASGRWPEDIKPTYQKKVRDILSYLGKTEEQFSADVQLLREELEHSMESADNLFRSIGYEFSGEVQVGSRYDKHGSSIIVGDKEVLKGCYPHGFTRIPFTAEEIPAIHRKLMERKHK